MTAFDPRPPRDRTPGPPRGLADIASRAGRRPAERDRWIGAALSLATHAAVVLALLWVWVPPPNVIDPAPILVSLIAPLPPPTPPSPPAPPTKFKTPKPPKTKPDKPRVVVKRAPERPPPPRRIARVAPAHSALAPRHAQPEPADGDADVSDAELANATSAGSGAPGGSCDMARRLQNALRRDPLVQAAVAQARASGMGGKAIRVWNGDWVQSRGEDGKGLSAVREAITWEVAFAPKACRSEPVHGLILISLNEAPGSARLLVGSGEWRWSDLLTLHPGGR